MEPQNIRRNKATITHELLFVSYFWGFALLRPLLQHFSGYSTLLLAIYVFFILVISIFKLFTNRILIRPYLLIIGVLFILLSDSIMRPNDYVIKYMYDFIIFGAIPIHLIAQVKDTRKMLDLYSLFSFTVFLLYSLDPFNGYSITGDYMSFGFDVALPAYFGIYIGRKVIGRKWMFPFELLCLLEVLIFANRSSFLSIISFLVVIEVFFIKTSIKHIAKIAIAMLAVGLIVVYLQDILAWIISLISGYGLYSASLSRINQYLFEANWERLFSGRLEIWELAKKMTQNNVLWGSGTGSFQSRYGIYSHNLYYDIIVQYGLSGLFIISILIINSIRSAYKHNGYTKLSSLLLFCLWFPKLLFSLYIFQDIGIWCFLAFGLISFRVSKRDQV